MNILILGNATDAHAAHLKTALEDTGATVNYWNTRLFPKQLRLSWQPDTDSGAIRWSDERSLNLQEIHSVFWRSFSGVTIPQLENAAQHNLAYQDAMSAMRSIIRACPARWVNSWEAYQFHQEKPRQLRTAKQMGATIPATLISNDPLQIIAFSQKYDRLIFKPVYGGSHTQFVTEEHLDPQRLQLALSLAPITIQEYIPGTNIRSYVIADSVYTAEIQSEAIDFREDQAARLIPLELPEAIRQQCFAIAKAFFLQWTAIDWRRKPNGEYVFLEANPSPMFLHFEQQTGFSITSQLVKVLMS